jgi:hypothetical protein
VDEETAAEFMNRSYKPLKTGDGRHEALASDQEEFSSGKVQSAHGVNWTEHYYCFAWQLFGD